MKEPWGTRSDEPQRQRLQQRCPTRDANIAWYDSTKAMQPHIRVETVEAIVGELRKPCGNKVFQVVTLVDKAFWDFLRYFPAR
jgi:hypothetical protein